MFSHFQILLPIRRSSRSTRAAFFTRTSGSCTIINQTEYLFFYWPGIDLASVEYMCRRAHLAQIQEALGVLSDAPPKKVLKSCTTRPRTNITLAFLGLMSRLFAAWRCANVGEVRVSECGYGMHDVPALSGGRLEGMVADPWYRYS